jgi:SAM-dependent methyltransferase
VGGPTPLGQLGISEGLRAFVEELPFERRPILDFVMAAASRLDAGVEVVDVGAGDAPYRELFAHVRYRTIDWEQSPHEGGRAPDLVGTATDLPLADQAVDAVLLTQVLEHLADPGRALAEAYRVLAPGGALLLTAPLAWEIHEAPYDFYRYTAYGLEYLIGLAGFTDIEVKPRNDTPSTLAQLSRNCAWHLLGSAGADAVEEQGARGRAAQALLDIADAMVDLAPLDEDWTFPLGYSARAIRPRELAR